MITTPSGGQTLLDKGFYNVTRPRLVGARHGQARRRVGRRRAQLAHARGSRRRCCPSA